ncbi:MAG: biopolymer transporter Tol, partial [Candidatus Krumholzibacteria bacterium]|nr:biopolymer transporter Tol [Candidatus Krumholzibacteria bacterium]
MPILFLGLCLISTSAVSWNHSEIEWKTIRTEHFEVHFHPGAEWSAEQTALIAEDIYGPITRFYGYEPNTVHISLYDFEDDPAGATYYYHDRIDISASSFYFYLRGTANWLRNVITHEFTHMVSIQRSMKFPLRIPAFHFQIISFEKEKRPDVITGYPNTFVSLPFTGEIMPNWFAEGLAQYQCGLARNDIWDSHRDMLLRVATLEDKLLTIDEIGVFDKNSLESEMVYNQGFSLVRFIADEFGRE